MNTYYLKKFRKRYSYDYVNDDDAYYPIKVVDHKLKQVHYYTTITQFFDRWLSDEYPSLVTKKLKKNTKREHEREYYKTLKTFKAKSNIITPYVKY